MGLSEWERKEGMLSPRGPFPKTLSNMCVLAAEVCCPTGSDGTGPRRLASLPAPAALGTLALLQAAPSLPLGLRPSWQGHCAKSARGCSALTRSKSTICICLHPFPSGFTLRILGT